MGTVIMIAAGLSVLLGWTYRNTLAIILGLVGVLVGFGVMMP